MNRIDLGVIVDPRHVHVDQDAIDSFIHGGDIDGENTGARRVALHILAVGQLEDAPRLRAAYLDEHDRAETHVHVDVDLGWEDGFVIFQRQHFRVSDLLAAP